MSIHWSDIKITKDPGLEESQWTEEISLTEVCRSWIHFYFKRQK